MTIRVLWLTIALMQTPVVQASDNHTATFAAGCFWCMEHPFDGLDGVLSVTAGYTGGKVSNPTYAQVSAGTTGHAEAVQIVFDPMRIRYRDLLKVYWRNSDPTVKDRQFCDHGSQYRPAIFYHGAGQQREAEASKAKVEQNKTFSAPIVTGIVPAGRFWAAESYHQHYYRKNPLRYKFYRYQCGRDARLQQLWGEEVADDE
ncbi:MAG: peptide-methionine (S)-S-oxide reductase MsrA [Mariprofundales bacterium]